MIYVCYHKPYAALASDVLSPIQVGKALATTDLGFQGDNTLDNISSKNPYFCELTATYWIWKNNTDDIVGLMHYRRFLNLQNTRSKAYFTEQNLADTLGLNCRTVSEYLQTFDAILPIKTKKTQTSVYEYYKNEHFQSDMDILLEVIKQKYPEMYDVAVTTLKDDTQMYVGNILIAKREIFNAYASWLFDLLFEVEKRIQRDVLLREAYQQRVYGFLAERMMAIYFNAHPEIKICERPLLIITDDVWEYRKYCFKQWRRKILSKLGIRKKSWNV